MKTIFKGITGLAAAGIFYGLPRTPSRGLYTDDVVDAICRQRKSG